MAKPILSKKNAPAAKKGSDEPKKKKFKPFTLPKRENLPLDPEDANLVNSIKRRLQEIREYKRILAEDGLRPDEDDKALESDLIVQLMRIEKGLPPKKKPKPKKKKAKVGEKKVKSPTLKAGPQLTTTPKRTR